jgi:gamma-glutamyl hercynylcysteine S-oxide synthase
VISELSKSSFKETIFHAFSQCRAKTLALFEGIDEATFRYQAHPDFSPVGWHLGHIAYTESLWVLERDAGLSCLFPQYRKLFAADGLPKSDRVKLPNLEEIRYYLDTVRDKVWDYLKGADLEQQERLWRFLLQHESQHSEIISFVLELVKSQQLAVNSYQLPVTSYQLPMTSHQSPVIGHQLAVNSYQLPVTSHQSTLEILDSVKQVEMIQIPAGEFEMGDDSVDALDNERPVQKLYLESYWIDRYCVTCGQYRLFMAEGGYQNPQWWSEAGWKWLQTEQVKQPLYWCENPMWNNHPVCGVSWYEAEAYARFVGKRLPIEAEWEKAASWDVQAHCRRIYPWGNEEPTLRLCNHDNVMGKTTPVNSFPAGQSPYGLYDALGNVWEWTTSWFDGYPGFQSYPYVGYSQVYFDQQHRVLKGGSWATRPWALRCSFRNWYHPWIRQILAGFRCAADEEMKSS